MPISSTGEIGFFWTAYCPSTRRRRARLTHKGTRCDWRLTRAVRIRTISTHRSPLPADPEPRQARSGRSRSIGPQLYCTSAFKLNSARKQVRALVLKGRQMGISTYVSRPVYWRISHKKGVRVRSLTHLDTASDNLFGMARGSTTIAPNW